MLCAFSANERALSLSQLASRVALPKATVHRLAGSLVATGFMQHRDDGHYALGPKLSELGALVRSELDVVALCATALDALADATGETVLVAAADWDALEITIVDFRLSHQTLSVVPTMGERLTIPPGAPGKALLLGLSAAETETVLERLPLPALTNKTHTDRLAFAEEIAGARSVGYAIAEGEFLDGVSGVAVPVLFAHGRPRAAIAVVGPSARIADRLERFGSLALELTATLRPTHLDQKEAA